MRFSRRSPSSATPVAMAAIAPAVTALAADRTAGLTTDLAVSCDNAAGAAVNAAAKAYRARIGVRVRVFPTPPGLILPQIEREIQNDIIFTQIETINQVAKAGLIGTGPRAGPWRNRLVTAEADPATGPAGSFAVPDPTPGSDIDGPAVLQRIGLAPARIVGVIDTGAVAWTLTNGLARQGLLHRTELVADHRLRALSPVPDDAWPPIRYAAAVTTLARRGDPAGFIAFLNSRDGLAMLGDAGLEATA